MIDRTNCQNISAVDNRLSPVIKAASAGFFGRNELAGEEQFKRVDAAKLERLVAAIYAGLGVPDDDARLLGHALVDADLRGVHSHGCRWVSVYARNIRAGGVNLHPTIRAVRDDGATCLLDGDGGLGHILAAHAMTVA